MKQAIITVLSGIGIVIVLYVGVSISGSNRAIIAHAVATNNASACRLLNYIPSFEVSPGYSLNDCYTKVGIGNNSPEACALVPAASNGYCYSQVAKGSGDISLCERIDSGDLSRGGCYEAFIQDKEDLSICVGLTDTNSRSACFMYYVINVDPESSICAQKVQQGDNHYQDHCYYAAATARKDIALCEKITLDYDKTNCKAQVLMNSR